MIEAVLEVMPKWELLREVMAEIQQERQALLSGGGGGGGGGGGDSEVVVLDSEGEEVVEEAPSAAAGAAAPAADADADAERQAAALAPVLVVCQDTFTARQVRRGVFGLRGCFSRLFRNQLASACSLNSLLSHLASA